MGDVAAVVEIESRPPAWLGSPRWLPGAPVTRNQVELMQIDTVATPGVPGFTNLEISPRPMEEVLESTLRSA